MGHRFLWLFSLVAVLSGSATGAWAFLVGLPGTLPPSCAEEARPFLQEVAVIHSQWSDASALAGQTPRMSLPPQIAQLQQLRRDLDALNAPACAADAQIFLSASMGRAIDGYLGFLSQSDQSDVDQAFREASAGLKLFESSLARINDPQAKE